MVGAIRVYQRLVSPFLGTNCRFVPSCSNYAQEAFRRHGPLRGAFLACWRILRCNPWNTGGYDPVPDRDCARASCCSSHR
nr:membrane protein insertion efficiency factor YidD [Gluconacetobacter sacchari]